MLLRIASAIHFINIEQLSLLIAVSNLVFHVQKEHEERHGLVHHLHTEGKKLIIYCVLHRALLSDTIIKHKSTICKIFYINI